MARDSGNIIILMLVDYCDFDLGPVFNQSYKFTYKGPLGGQVMELRSGTFVSSTQTVPGLSQTPQNFCYSQVACIFFLLQSAPSHRSTANFIFQICNSFTGLSQEKKTGRSNLYQLFFSFPYALLCVSYQLETESHWAPDCENTRHFILLSLFEVLQQYHGEHCFLL